MKLIPLALAATLLSAAAARADFALKANDRVVFFGDSITEFHNYTRPFQDYVYARYPERHIHFYNAGWGGDVTPRALNRLDRDVLSLDPTVVTLCFGMNDGNYRTLDDGIAETYRANLDGIVKALTDRKIRVIMFPPPPVDYDRRENLRGANYNDNLEALGNIAQKVAAKYGASYVDIFHPILQTQNALKAQNAGFTMIPDGVHPDETGGVVMAGAMLMGMGAEPMPPLADTKIVGENTAIPAQSNLVPLWMNENSANAARVSGFLPIAGQMVRVRGLKAGLYDVQVDGKNAGMWNNAQLEAGVTVAGTYSNRARRVFDVTNWKEGNYFNLWRNLRLGDAQGEAVDAAASALMNADGSYQNAIESLSAPTAAPTISVAATGLPADIGPNLAQGKPYVVSDPNVYGYGPGALTDGSWSASEPHTFASGEKETFPKTATIDLGAVQPVKYVWMGVPPFGSTKTVEVSLSEDGQNFTPIGKYVFSQRREERHLFEVAPTNARYVRLNYPDHYAEFAGYAPNFVFTSEVQVFGG